MKRKNQKKTVYKNQFLNYANDYYLGQDGLYPFDFYEKGKEGKGALADEGQGQANYIIYVYV